jgi:hypothetical protein
MRPQVPHSHEVLLVFRHCETCGVRLDSNRGSSELLGATVLSDLVCLLPESFGETLVVQPARGIEFFIISSQGGGVFIKNTITREQELVKKLEVNRKKANSYEHLFITGRFLKVAESRRLVNGVIFHSTIIGVLLKSSGLDSQRRRKTIRGLGGGRSEDNF